MNCRLLKKVLITGASGFVGAYLSKAFSGAGYSTICTDRMSKNVPEGCEFIQADLLDIDLLKEKFSNIKVDLIIHCASQQPRKECPLDDYYKGNVLALNNVLDLMSSTDTKNIITFSSATVFGKTGTDVLSENSPVYPDSSYALTKFAGEQLLNMRTVDGGFTSVCFRLPSLFGYGQVGGIVSTYYGLAKNGGTIEVFSNGRLMRNLLHVEEVVQAVLKGADKIGEMTGYNLYLLGSSDSLSMLDIAKFVADKIGNGAKAVAVDTPAPVDSHWNISVDKARSHLGFVPASIQDGLTRYIGEMKRFEINAKN